MYSSIMVIGYGNPGRRDDGLGPALAAAVEQLGLPGVTTDADYQLTVEDAAAIAGHDCVIFADAATAGPEPFDFQSIQPGGSETGFSSHSVEPAAVLTMAGDLFGASPQAFVLAIRGYEFDVFEERLSPEAVRNLTSAVEFVESWVRAGGQAAAPGGTGRTCAAPSPALARS